MKKTIGQVFLAIFWLTVLLTGCATKGTPTSAPSTAIPATAIPITTSTVPIHAGTIAFGKADPAQDHDDIYLIQTDGTGPTQLTDNHGSTESPAWSPDGSKIAYQFLPMKDREVTWPYQVWVMNADGSGQTQLTHDQVGGSYPAWSLDGKQIALNSWFYPEGEYGPAQIYVMNADGSELRRLTNGPDNDMFPTYAPNGTIMFLRKKMNYDSSFGDVFAINPDGTGLVQVTTVGYVGWYALSPDGIRIAIHDKRQHLIVILTVDGSEPPRTLVDTDFGYDFVQISWSPDGKALALARADLMNIYGFSLYIVNVDGSGLTTVPNAKDVFSIAWRPK